MKTTLLLLLALSGLSSLTYGQKITALPAATDAADTDVIEITDVSVPRSEKLTISLLKSQIFASPTLTTPTISGAVTFPDGTRQTFNPSGTTPGLNVGSHTADPSTPANGDLWYDSTNDLLRARIDGATVSLGAGGGGGLASTDIDTSTELGAILTDETGTGAFVRAGSPTFTGTAVFATMTATTLNATSLAINNGADPTTNAAGEIAIDTDDLFLEFYDGTASRVVGAVQTASVTIYDPDGVQAVSDALPILAVEATWAPHGITVRDIYLKTDASSTYSIDLEEWTSITGGATSIEVVATSASAEAEDDGTLSDASVAAGSIVFVDLPATTANFITVSFTYTINPGN